MKTRPLATLSLIFISLLVTFLIPAFDTSLYGVDGNPLLWWSFLPSDPFRQFGLTLIVAPFLHMNFSHLVINTVLLVPVALMMERKLSGKSLLLSFSGVHVLSIILLLITSLFIDLSKSSFLGTSHIVVGLYAYWALANRKFSLLVFALGVLLVGFWQDQNPLTILAHGLGIVSGIMLFGLGRLRRK